MHVEVNFSVYSFFFFLHTLSFRRCYLSWSAAAALLCSDKLDLKFLSVSHFFKVRYLNHISLVIFSVLLLFDLISD